MCSKLEIHQHFYLFTIWSFSQFPLNQNFWSNLKKLLNAFKMLQSLSLYWRSAIQSLSQFESQINFTFNSDHYNFFSQLRMTLNSSLYCSIGGGTMFINSILSLRFSLEGLSLRFSLEGFGYQQEYVNMILFFI